MNRRNLTWRVSLLLIVSLLIQPLAILPVNILPGSTETGVAYAAPVSQSENNTIYLPLVSSNKLGPPDFVINSPTVKKISGTLRFSIQPVGTQPISSVVFKVGNIGTVTDTAPSNGFSVILVASSFTKGELALSATAIGPGGEKTLTKIVEVEPNPPANTTISADGAVVATETGSVVAIPPGGAPAGTTIKVKEKTQQEVTTDEGIDWDRLGVTFLGAQQIETSSPVDSPLMVSSAGFAKRVQPGQVVVNYAIVPDADGDGVSELAVINSASVSSSGAVFSDQVEQLIVNAPSGGIRGKPGTILRLQAQGFTPSSVYGSVGEWQSKVNGEKRLFPVLITFDNDNPVQQTIALVIPPLETGAATLTLQNLSSGSVAQPIQVTVDAGSIPSGSAPDILDKYLADTIAYFENSAEVPAENMERMTDALKQMQKVRDALANAVAEGLRSQDEILLKRITRLVVNAPIYQGSGYSANVSADDVMSLLMAFAGLMNEIEREEVSATSLHDGEETAIIGAVIMTGILVGGVWAVLEAARIQKIFCKAAQRQRRTQRPTTGMGSAPPRGGPLCGGTTPPPPSQQNQLNAAADNADELPVIVKIYPRGTTSRVTPFSGIVDPSGYFYIPLIAEGELFSAVAYDPQSGASRKYPGVGVAEGEAQQIYIDLSTIGTEPNVARWDGGGDGTSWTDPLNWQSGLLPKADDTVIIDVSGSTITVTAFLTTTQIKALHTEENFQLSGGTLIIDNNTVISNGLTLSDGELTINGDLTVKGPLTWSGGTMSGSGKTVAQGNMIFNGRFVTLDGRTLDNAGTAIWNYDQFVQPTITLNNNAIFNNLAGATFTIERTNQLLGSFINGDFNNPNTAQFNNEGTIVVNLSADNDDSSFNYLLFNNTGTVNVQDGQLSLNDGSSSGTFTVAAGATLTFAGNYTLDETSSVSGAGEVEFSGDNVNVEGTYAVTGLTSVTGGTATMNTGSALILPLLNVRDGTLTSPNDIIVSGVLTWSGGTMSGSGKTVAQGNMIFNGRFVTLDGRTLDNVGTAIWNYDQFVQPTITLNNNAIFNNLAGATFTIERTRALSSFIVGDFNNPNTSQFNNAGTLVVNLSAENDSTSFNNLFFNNTGTVNVQNGELYLNDGSSSGTIDISGGTTVDINGTFENQSSGQINGTGTLDTSNGTFTNSGTIAPSVIMVP